MYKRQIRIVRALSGSILVLLKQPIIVIWTNIVAGFMTNVVKAIYLEHAVHQ